ncbi:hypothetical protein [Actinoplanes subglobosus]|uniref:Lipoprotein n=1 Tax=Actinoplanes subglobosus TaxID=1547892 RepID=A0ABV8IY10_9ACTN
MTSMCPRWIRGAALVCALAVVPVGCGGTRDAASPNGGPSATSAPAVATPTAPATTSSSPAPARTTVSPTAPPPCRQSRGWSQEQTADWLSDIVDVSTTAVEISPSTPELCDPVTMQVEFFKVTFTPAGADYEFDIKSVKRTRVTVEGRRFATVEAPEDLTVGRCATVLATAYVGAPLRPSELPSYIDDIAGLSPKVYFDSERLVGHDLAGLGSALNLAC